MYVVRLCDTPDINLDFRVEIVANILYLICTNWNRIFGGVLVFTPTKRDGVGY